MLEKKIKSYIPQVPNKLRELTVDRLTRCAWVGWLACSICSVWRWKVVSYLIKCQKRWSLPMRWIETNTDRSRIRHWGLGHSITEPKCSYYAVAVFIKYLYVTATAFVVVDKSEIYIDFLLAWHCDLPITRFVVWVVPREIRAVNDANRSSWDDWWTTWNNQRSLRASSFIVMDNFHCTVDCRNICTLAHV